MLHCGGNTARVLQRRIWTNAQCHLPNSFRSRVNTTPCRALVGARPNPPQRQTTFCVPDCQPTFLFPPFAQCVFPSETAVIFLRPSKHLCFRTVPFIVSRYTLGTVDACQRLLPSNVRFSALHRRSFCSPVALTCQHPTSAISTPLFFVVLNCLQRFSRLLRPRHLP